MAIRKYTNILPKMDGARNRGYALEVLVPKVLGANGQAPRGISSLGACAPVRIDPYGAADEPVTRNFAISQ